MTAPGTVVVSIAADAATDAAGNASTTSTSTDNTVTYDNVSPVFVRIETAAGSATVVAVFDEPVLSSSAATGDFLAAVSGLPVAVSAIACTGTSDATVDVTLASALPEGATTALTLDAGAVTDPASNASGGAITHTASSGLLPRPAGPRTPLTCGFVVVGTGVDPVTSRFSGARSTN